MVKIFYFSLLILQMVFSTRNCLKPSDICIISDTECKGTYDKNHNYEEKCGIVKCEGKFHYQCANNKCTIDQITCEHLNKISFSLRSFRNLRMYQTQLSKYQDFVKHIKNCPSIEHKWLPIDLCLNGKNCFFKQVLRLKSGKINVIKETECPCSGDYTYHCGYDYCAVNKMGCEKFKSIKNESTSLLIDIKRCNNDNAVISRNFLFI